ncbi:uncharacterized protein LOC117784564 [Drosophila innubila]|uniref:uncharacterized protein LOC117784564 n=1 Tax=Drosophila innubila TaxID=198719 RepID=UPI00148BA69F|nr:uncharacterized protein LOC117784564 [Drosophila innubila]
MKLLFVLVTYLAFASAYDISAQSATDLAAYRAQQQECVKELKLPTAEGTQIASDKEVTNPSDAYKCYHNCLYKKMGLVTGDNPNNEAILKFAQARFNKVPLEKLKTELKGCTAAMAKGASTCESIYNYESCVVKALKA